MKKHIGILCLILMGLVCFTACQKQQAQETEPKQTETVSVEQTQKTEPEEPQEPVCPADLLTKMYNPFYSATWPDGYMVDQVRLRIEEPVYVIELTTNDTEENVVTAMSDLLGESSADNIAKNINWIKENGAVNISGFLQDQNINVQADIHQTDEGIRIYFSTEIDPDKYKMFLTQNFNEAILGIENQAEPFFSDQTFQKGSLIVCQKDQFINCERTYSLNDEEYQKCLAYFTSDSFLSAMAQISKVTPKVFNDGNFTQVQFEQNHIFVGLSMNNEGDFIHIDESAMSLDKNLIEYTTPSLNLKSLTGKGFEDYIQENHNITCKDKDYGIFIAIHKKAWGDDRDYIMVTGNLYEKYHLEYDPDKKLYMIDMEEQAGGKTLLIPCYYDPESKQITPGTGWDESGVKNNIKELTGLDEAAGLDQILSYFTDYIADRFGMTPDELFAAEVE